jgi:ribonuclease HI
MPSRDDDSTRWVRMRFKNGKVWVAADAGGRPADAGGRARIKYRLDQEQEYRVRAENLRPIEAPGTEVAPTKRPQGCPAAADAGDANCVHVYTDGACSGNPGPAGIGIVLVHGSRRKEISDYIGVATNNIAELTAIQRGLASLKKGTLPVRVYTDSRYAQGVLTLNWKTRKNQELVAAVRREMDRFSDIELVKVAGHCGVQENERADRLAVAAVEEAMRR